MIGIAITNSIGSSSGDGSTDFSALLLEDGEPVLLESNNYIKLETDIT